MCAINKTSVVKIIHEDPKLKCLKKRCLQQKKKKKKKTSFC